ncbi:hypothetical protein IMCC3317_27860 [Kordia antarctica]|uniref:Uncharacterized protein n=1 Tax=Kordia antarctica TaxID=1218801 RepID=A0A7L4ZLN8_9FLAO|nr:hypothetical protein [Kordia antarctica]QHI37407.1 hypothetical protein IMCC3317_27860 [Kordia antarctica]
MKKQLKKLSLSKKVVANFNEVQGGRAPETHGQTCEGMSCELCGPSNGRGLCEPGGTFGETCPTD